VTEFETTKKNDAGTHSSRRGRLYLRPLLPLEAREGLVYFVTVEMWRQSEGKNRHRKVFAVI